MIMTGDPFHNLCLNFFMPFIGNISNFQRTKIKITGIVIPLDIFVRLSQREVPH